MESLQCESITEVEQSLSRLWPTVIVMTVKGNLRHRIEKLGEELDEAALSDKQRVLRRIAIRQGFEELLADQGIPHLARPVWGKGAFFYCEPALARLVQDNCALFPFKLQSKHLVCSPEYEVALRDCLEEPPAVLSSQPKGREMFLKKRAGQVKVYQVVELPGYPMLDLSQVSSEQLDPELMDYLMAPSGVQLMAPETWEAVWQNVQQDEEELIMPAVIDGEPALTCTICGNGTVMNLPHLCFSGCVDRFRPRVDPNTLFGAVVKCAQDSRPKVYVVGE